MTSVVLIVPADKLVSANRLAELKGWGPECYTIPLAIAGSQGPTHYGLRTTVADGFLQEMGAAAQGVMPEIDMEPAEFFGVMQSVIFDYRDDPVNHFQEVCESNSLTAFVGESDL